MIVDLSTEMFLMAVIFSSNSFSLFSSHTPAGVAFYSLNYLLCLFPSYLNHAISRGKLSITQTCFIKIVESQSTLMY